MALQAIKRIRYILDTKEHFTHQEREKGNVLQNQMHEQKRAMYDSLSQSTNEGGHLWQGKGRAFQCTQCLKRVTMHTKLADRQQTKQEHCPGTPVPLVGGQMVPADLTKQETVKQILEGSFQDMGQHYFEFQKSYMVCKQCGGRLQEKLITLAKTECWNRAWVVPAGWQGHGSHQMSRKGHMVICKGCHARAIQQDGEWKASRALKQVCGENEVKITLPQCFKAKTAEDSECFWDCH